MFCLAADNDCQWVSESYASGHIFYSLDILGSILFIYSIDIWTQLLYMVNIAVVTIVITTSLRLGQQGPLPQQVLELSFTMSLSLGLRACDHPKDHVPPSRPWVPRTLDVSSTNSELTFHPVYSYLYPSSGQETAVSRDVHGSWMWGCPLGIGGWWVMLGMEGLGRKSGW